MSVLAVARTCCLVYLRGEQHPPPPQSMPPASLPVCHLPPAGVGLAAGVQVSGLASWLQLASREVLLKLAPALAMLVLITAVLHRIRSVGCTESGRRVGGGRRALAGSQLGACLVPNAACMHVWVAVCLLACCSSAQHSHSPRPMPLSLHCRSPFALPALLVAAPALFYLVLFATGVSLDDAREAGWVSKPQVSVCLCVLCEAGLSFDMSGCFVCQEEPMQQHATVLAMHPPSNCLTILPRLLCLLRSQAAGGWGVAVLACLGPVQHSRLSTQQHFVERHARTGGAAAGPLHPAWPGKSCPACWAQHESPILASFFCSKCTSCCPLAVAPAWAPATPPPPPPPKKKTPPPPPPPSLRSWASWLPSTLLWPLAAAWTLQPSRPTARETWTTTLSWSLWACPTC